MDLSFTPRPPVRRRRRRLLIAATTAVSSILIVRFGSLNYYYYESEVPEPREKSDHIHQLQQQQPQQQPPPQPPQQSEQQQRRRLDECYEAPNNWHLAMNGKNTCSNDNKFPPSWLNSSMARFFQPTCQECCKEMFPRLNPSDCACVDVCEQQEDLPCATNDPCCDRYWHPDVTASFTCTNTYSTDGTTYPAYWNDNELMVGTSMFKTVEDCCNKLTNGDVAKCVIVEAEECKTADGDGGGEDEGSVTTPTPTPSPTTATPTPRPTTATPTPRPTLHITIPPHLLQPQATPRPTLQITIPPHLLKPDPTPRPTIHLTIPPQLYKPPTNPPQDIMVPQSSPVMVPQSSPVQVQNNCSSRRRRRRCIKNSNCEWVRANRTCRAISYSSSVGVVSNDESSTTTGTTDTNDAVCTNGFKWHRGKPSEGSKCTNDFNYPSAWDDPQLTDKFLFDTPYQCCLAHFTLETCTIINACGGQLTDVSSSSSQNSALVPMTVAIPSSVNCSRKGRRKCNLDPNCKWKRAPFKECVAA